MKTQGFTLIELLAVIVILAIIALIATPIVLGIISDTKESAMLRSAEFYLDGVENAVMKENLNQNGNFKPTECGITENGNLYCSVEDVLLDIEVDGETPIDGTIIFEEGKIKEVTLTYQSGTIVKDQNGNLVYEGSNSNVTYESLGNWEHKLVDGTIEKHTDKNTDGLCDVCDCNEIPGLYKTDGTFVSWEQLLSVEYQSVTCRCGYCDTINCPILKVENGVLKSNDACDLIFTNPSSDYLNGELVIPNSVTSISDYAFYGCTNLTTIIIPNSITSIGHAAFYGCSSLTSIIIPNSVTSISEYSFSECTNLSSVTIPDSVTSIGEAAFWFCENLTSITIPDSVITISDSAFSNTGLTSISIPNSVTSIGDYTFSSCKNLTSITIPNTVASIGDHLFYGCSSLESIVIPNSVTNIDVAAFMYCSSLETITIPNLVTKINENAFRRCTSLTSINYNGTKEEWNNIQKYVDGDCDWNAECPQITVHCTDGDIIIPAWSE